MVLVKETSIDEDLNETYISRWDRKYNTILYINNILEKFYMTSLTDKKTVFANFSVICELLNRPENHVLCFIKKFEKKIKFKNDLFEIKGIYFEENIKKMILEYCLRYIICYECNSVSTYLTDKSSFICKSCKSKCWIKKYDYKTHLKQ